MKEPIELLREEPRAPLSDEQVLLQSLGLSAIRPKRTSEAICSQLRRQISKGALRAGDRLPSERELADQFAVSKGAVRDAIRSLEIMGVVESRAGARGGVFIRGSTPEGMTQALSDAVSLGQMPIRAVTETRIEVTCMAVRLACQRASDAELDAIDADIDLHAELFERSGGSRNFISLGRFYRLIAEATHNPMIVMLVDSITEVMDRVLSPIDPRPNPAMIPVRRKALKHLRARDADRACAVLKRHLEHLTDYLEAESRQAAASPR